MSEKLVIDKSTLEGIGNAVRTKKGTSDLIPVPNLESEILSIPTGGGGKSYFLKEDYMIVSSSPSLTQVATGCESAELTSSNFSAVDVDGNPYVPIAPEGANYVVAMARSSATTVRDLMAAKGYSRDIYNSLNEVLSVGSNLAKTRWCINNAQSNGLYFCNGSTLALNGHGGPANFNDFTSFFGMKEAIFGEYDHDTIARYTANNTTGGLYINDNRHLVAILCKRASGTAGPYAIFKPNVQYSLLWFHFDSLPFCGFFLDPYMEG